MTTAKKTPKPKAPKKQTAREKLQISKYHATQLELMGDDVDLTSLYLALNHHDINIVEAVSDVTVHRTIEGASTVTVRVNDRDGILLNSGRLSSKNDTMIDGLFFRLVSVDLGQDFFDLTLTFEDREIAVLRTYAKPIKQSQQTSRDQVTRARFILRMIKEVKEFKIPTVIPELDKQSAIDGGGKTVPTKQKNNPNKNLGIPKKNELHVKTGGGSRMTEEQRKNANTILDVGASMALQRKFLVMAIMCTIQEASIRNLSGPFPHDPHAHYGCFQQASIWGWPASGDVATDAKAFYEHLVKSWAQHQPAGMGYADAIESIQGSGLPQLYAQWRTQAEQIVTTYGLPFNGVASTANAQWSGGQVSNAEYEFYRGIPPTTTKRKQKYGGGWGPENTWDCIQRLAGEVQWRAFFVSGTFYYIAEDVLFASQPIATFDRTTAGVNSIGPANYNENSKAATVELSVQMNKWAAPPGSVIQLVNMGPWNGRWLVNDVERSLFNATGTITLKKPLPRLPEPEGGNIVNDPSSQTWTGKHTGGDHTKDVKITSSAAAARRILKHYDGGSYRDDNGLQLSQWKKIAAGKQLTSQCGTTLWIDPRVPNAIAYLLDVGYNIGTYAVCEDHKCYSHGTTVSQHSKGQAVDVSSIGKGGTWYAMNSYSKEATALAKEIMTVVKNHVQVDQLICNGVGRYDTSVQALQLNNGHYQGGVWVDDHITHFHLGVVPSKDPGADAT